jgi:cell wall-associated NlpC family hydrolase
VRLRLVGRASFRSIVVLTAATAIVCVSAATVAAEPPAIAAKRAEAQQVLEDIHALDTRLEKAVEDYDAATAHLEQIKAQQVINTKHLVIARRNLTFANNMLASRVRALYTSDQPQNSTLAILLGSSSLTDFINRIDTTSRVADEDTQVLHEIHRFKGDVTRRATFLRHAHVRQATVVAERAAARSEIESGLAERQRLLSSIQSEIVHLQAEEAARQAKLRAEAEARFQAQLEAARAASQEGNQARADNAPTDVVGAAAVTPEGQTIAPPSQYGGVVGIAMQQLGTPYVWGGSSPGGFDCSGLVAYVYSQVGVSLPHYSGAQWQMGTPVSKDQLEPGDLVFFDGVGHVGIYIGGGQFIHAPHTGDVVKISSLSDSWYAGTYDGARRL